jgi:hypothetical protein
LLRATNEMLENEDNSLNEYMIHFDQEW